MKCFSRLLSMIALALIGGSLPGQETTERDVVVKGSSEEFEEPGDYGQPQWAERSRASSTTKLYVLSPYEVFIGLLSESNFPRHGKSAHDLTQEIEIGLPHRFEIGVENRLGAADGDVGETAASIAARYAFGAWSAIPLNPAISAQYEFGAGRRFIDNSAATRRDQPDSYEVRLLLGQEFVPRLQWAANLFFQQELGEARDRNLGFTQNISYLAIADRLEFGTEMRFTHSTNKDRTRSSENEFVIGPSIGWKPNRHTVINVAPLFGCTHESPRVELFMMVSLEFGGGESKTTEPPR